MTKSHPCPPPELVAGGGFASRFSAWPTVLDTPLTALLPGPVACHGAGSVDVRTLKEMLFFPSHPHALQISLIPVCS